MKKQLVFNDYELDFLKMMGIEKKDNYFVNLNTGEKIDFIDEYEDKSDVDNVGTLYTFACKNSDIRITFIRGFERGLQPKQGFVKIRLNGIEYYAAEYYFNGEIRRRVLGTKSTFMKNPEDLDYSEIEVGINDSSDYFSKTWISGKSDYGFSPPKILYGIYCSLSSIYPNIWNEEEFNKKTNLFSVELSVPNYINSLTDAINKEFHDFPNIRAFYLKNLPFLLKAFEESLTIVAKSKDYYIERLENRKKRINEDYNKKIQLGNDKDAQTEMLTKLQEVEKMYAYLNNYFSNLDINNHQSQKR